MLLPYPADLAAFAFENLASLAAFDAKTGERRSKAMVSFMMLAIRDRRCWRVLLVVASGVLYDVVGVKNIGDERPPLMKGRGADGG